MSARRLVKTDIALKDWEFEFQQRNAHPMLMADFWCAALYRHLVPEIRLPIKPYDYIFTGSSKGYVKKQRKAALLRALKAAIHKDSYRAYIYRETEKRVITFSKVADTIQQQTQNASGRELLKLWHLFEEHFLRLIPWYYIPYYVTESNVLSDAVQKGLAWHQPRIELITDMQNALMTLIFPTKPMGFQEEQRALYGLVKLAGKKAAFARNPKFSAAANQYLREFGWMKTFILLPILPLSFPELVKNVDAARRGSFVEEYEVQERQRANNKKVAAVLLKILRSDTRLLKDIEWARGFGWLLTWSVEDSIRSLARLQPFFRATAEKIGVPYRDWILLTREEIAWGIHGASVPKRELAKRRAGYVFLMERGRSKFVTGPEGVRLTRRIEEYMGEPLGRVDTISGQSASPGRVTGRVRVALGSPESRTLEEGEILVCPMTSPDYVPAMKRSAAIVTDEGGLLSHAAIMSREFGKPCIVGTKIATRVLKDGDLVEVDADKGVVQVLSPRK